MTDLITQALSDLESWILAFAATPWVYVVLLVFATVDGFFPPIPSESVVIALAVPAVTTGNPHVVLLLVAASLGAWLGDQIAYLIGRGIGTERVPFLRGVRGRKAVAWADATLKQRGASFILAARYVPIGRVAVNMTAGALRYPRRRFVVVSAIAAVMWSCFSVVIGSVAASWVGHNTILAMAVGIGLGLAVGVALDQVMSLLARRRGHVTRRSDAGPRSPALAEPADVVGVCSAAAPPPELSE